jgi:hypothetical protein
VKVQAYFAIDVFTDNFVQSHVNVASGGIAMTDSMPRPGCVTAGRKFFRPACAALLLPLLAACSDSSNNRSSGGGGTDPQPAAAPYQELYDQGITRYFGEYTPMLSEEADGVVTHTFGVGDGPLCLDGSEYRMATRDVGDPELVIFLQGGGGCWSEFCAATISASAGIPAEGILDPNREDNPVKDANVAYFPYCDGGLHGSDRDVDTDNDGVDDRFQRGLHNLSAGLDVTLETFPNPERVILMGVSGGGLGTSLALPLVRHHYPDVPIVVVNDAGVGVARPDQPEFRQLLLDDWNLGALVPKSCADCLSDDGHFTEVNIWLLQQDENVRHAMLSATRDSTFADFFLMIGGDAFEAALFEEMQQLEAAVPDRQRSWIYEGVEHTFLQRDPDATAGGVPLMEWLTLMLEGSDDWVSVRD